MNFKKAKIYDADGNMAARWTVYYYFKDPDTGKYHRISQYISSKFLTRSQRYNRGREMVKEINYKLSRGFNPFAQHNRSLTSLSVSLDYYLETTGVFHRPRTNTSYKSYIKQFRRWAQDNGYDKLPIDGFNYNHAGLYMESVGRRKISKRTYNNILQAVKTCFNFLVEKEYLMVNPFFKQKKIKLEDTEIIAFTPSELSIVSQTLPAYDYNLYVIALLIFNCFLRPQEIVRLKVRHLNGIGDLLHVSGEISKNKKEETITLPPAVKQAIRKLDLGYPGEYYVFARGMKRGEKEIAPTRLAEAWGVYAKKNNLEKNNYALKHTGNRMAIQAGANARDLQLQNRHSSLEETQKYLDRFSRRTSDSFLKSLPSL